MALTATCSVCRRAFWIEAEDPRRKHSEPSRAWGLDVDPVCDDCRRVKARELADREDRLQSVLAAKDAQIAAERARADQLQKRIDEIVKPPKPIAGGKP
jgi:hypothetical protein